MPNVEATGQIAYAGIVSDPNWLLSTMAQSAAALVAIIGGFLLSRVVTLSSERQGLERRTRELDQRTRDLAGRLQHARQQRRKASWERFVNRAAEDCAEMYEKQGSVSPESLANKYWVRGVPTRKEMLELASRLVQTTQQASEHFERGGGWLERSKTDPQVWIVYRAVNNARAAISRAARERTSDWSPLDSLSDFGPIFAASDSDDVYVWKQERYDKLIETERELHAGLSALEREGELVRTELARVAKPQGLWLAAFSFGYLTLVGVLVPMVGLAWRPVPSDLLSRRVLLSCS